MSYLRWIPSPSDPSPPRRSSLWRYFPLAVILCMAVVVAVNAGMIYAALHTFPGAAGDDESFALSNHYDTVLEQQQSEATLGWVITAETDDTGRVVVTLANREGVPLRDATLTVSAERPLGAPQTRELRLQSVGHGHYVADTPLPQPGQWQLTLSASTADHAMTVTRRVIVR